MALFPFVEYNEVDVRCLVGDEDRKGGLIQRQPPHPVRPLAVMRDRGQWLSMVLPES